MSEYKTAECKSGYIINKQLCNSDIIDKIKKDLTVKPFVNNNTNSFNNDESNTEFKIYRETDKFMIIPRKYGRDNIGSPDSISYPESPLIQVEFKGKLRPYQSDIMKTIIPDILEKGGGVLSIPCGFGKSCMALYVASHLGLKTLILVHKSFLMNQWKETIAQFLPDAKVGIIRQDKVDTDDKDIVIGMIQSISMKQYDPLIFDHGFCVIDECHRINSKVFSRAFFKINCKYILGLSATFHRSDKLERVFNYFVGDILYKIENSDKKYASVEIYNVQFKDSKFKTIQYTNRSSGKNIINTAKMINNITEIEDRNQLIVDLIINKKTEDPGRNILLLSDRIDHLKTLHNMLLELKPEYENIVGFYIGGMKANDLKISEEKDIIFSSFSLSSEGLDIKRLNTIFLTTPKVKITQSVGRIFRKQKIEEFDGTLPLVVDINDNLMPFDKYSFPRNKVYKKLKFIQKHYSVVDNQINFLYETKVKEDEVESEDDKPPSRYDADCFA